jgi:hypothetical protein
MPFTIDGQKHLIQMPFVARTKTPAPELIGERLAEFLTPLPDSLVSHEDTPDEEQLFDVSVAQAEPIIEPHAMANDFHRKAIVLVSLRGGKRSHAWLSIWESTAN